MNMRFCKSVLCAAALFVCFSACTKQQSNRADNNQQVQPTTGTAVIVESETHSAINSDSETIMTSDKKTIKDNELLMPQKLLFYSNGQDHPCSSTTTRQVMANVNLYINTGTLRATKMAVNDEKINTIKSSQKCIEIEYSTTQHLKTSSINGAAANYEFNKVLFVLDGDYRGLLFFAQKDAYLSGPLKGSSEHDISDILSICS